MIKSTFILLAVPMLLSGAPAYAAPPRMETLVVGESEARLEFGCTPDKRCVELIPPEAGCDDSGCVTDSTDGADLGLTLSGGTPDPAHTPFRMTDLSSEGEYSSLQLWPKLIRFDGGSLVGVETGARAMYSGGGADSSTLHLIAFLPGQAPFVVLSVPWKANVMIRACFSEADMAQRAGACHDEYNFDADIAIVDAHSDGMPVLRYRSNATSFPGRVSRSGDSLAARPLRKRDLVTVTDPECSYERSYRFEPGARAYVPDTPAPECTDYTVP